MYAPAFTQNAIGEVKAVDNKSVVILFMINGQAELVPYNLADLDLPDSTTLEVGRRFRLETNLFLIAEPAKILTE